MTVLRWTHDPSEGSADGFTLHAGTESGRYDTTLDLGPVAPVCIYSYDAGATLPIDGYVALSAYNANGESDLSNELPEPAVGIVFAVALLVWLTRPKRGGDSETDTVREGP